VRYPCSRRFGPRRGHACAAMREGGVCSLFHGRGTPVGGCQALSPSHSFTPSLSRSLSLTRSLAHFLIPSLSYSLTLSLFHCITLSHPQSLSRTPSISHSCNLSIPHSFPHSLTLSLGGRQTLVRGDVRREWQEDYQGPHSPLHQVPL